MATPLNILYLVHDVSDPAVARRTAMLQEGGAAVTIAGFRRIKTPLQNIGNTPIIDLGQTHNGGFLHRLFAVIRECLTLSKHKKTFASADLILARNLEMLAIGVRAKSLCRPAPTLIYESLDIHRLLLHKSLIGKTLRHLEGWLSKRASALLTSSPAFIHEYFEKRSHVRLPTYLVENKLYPASLAQHVPPRKPSAPWVIGWFGAIRCQKSLALLKTLVRESNGKIHVIIRGRPSLDQFTNFEKETTDTPGLRFEGPYKPTDLPHIYSEVHFTWAIDMFEEGQNSSWLLPNRLYEGGAFASVPIAAASVETGHAIQRLHIGVPLIEPKAEALKTFFETLTPAHYQSLEIAARNIPLETWIADSAACQDLVQTLRHFCPITILRKVP